LNIGKAESPARYVAMTAVGALERKKEDRLWEG